MASICPVECTTIVNYDSGVVLAGILPKGSITVELQFTNVEHIKD